MSLKVTKATETEDLWGINMLLIGNSGAGKTTFSVSAGEHPDGKDVLLVDLEGGARSITNAPNTFIYDPQSTKELEDVYRELSTTKHNYRTLVIDSITEAYEMWVTELKPANEPPQLQTFGRATYNLKSFMRRLRALSHSKKLNCIFTCHLKEVTDESSKRVTIGPAFGDSTSRAVRHVPDMVSLLEVNPRTGERTLNSALSTKFAGRIRQSRHSSGTLIPGSIEDPTMSKLLDIINKKGE